MMNLIPQRQGCIGFTYIMCNVFQQSMGNLTPNQAAIHSPKNRAININRRPPQNRTSPIPGASRVPARFPGAAAPAVAASRRRVVLAAAVPPIIITTKQSPRAAATCCRGNITKRTAHVTGAHLLGIYVDTPVGQVAGATEGPFRR